MRDLLCVSVLPGGNLAQPHDAELPSERSNRGCGAQVEVAQPLFPCERQREFERRRAKGRGVAIAQHPFAKKWDPIPQLDHHDTQPMVEIVGVGDEQTDHEGRTTRTAAR